MMYCRKKNKEKEGRKGGRVSRKEEEERKKEERKKKKEKEEKGSYLEGDWKGVVRDVFISGFFISYF